MPLLIRYSRQCILSLDRSLSRQNVGRLSSRPSCLPYVRQSIGSSRIVSHLDISKIISSDGGYPDAVFFSSKCGVARGSTLLTPGQGLPADEEESDNRCRSVGAAVQFAKTNNLLGVILNANLLVRRLPRSSMRVPHKCILYRPQYLRWSKAPRNTVSCLLHSARKPNWASWTAYLLELRQMRRGSTRGSMMAFCPTSIISSHLRSRLDPPSDNLRHFFLNTMTGLIPCTLLFHH